MNSEMKQIRSDLGRLKTEGRNLNTMHIDTMSTLDMMTVMNNENRAVEDAIATQLPQIAQAVDIIATALEAGGHLIYIGAGTSGRLGAMSVSPAVARLQRCMVAVDGRCTTIQTFGGAPGLLTMPRAVCGPPVMPGSANTCGNAISTPATKSFLPMSIPS